MPKGAWQLPARNGVLSTFDESQALTDNRENLPSWACGAAGSALPWHGRGRRFDPDQVHQILSFTWQTCNSRQHFFQPKIRPNYLKQRPQRLTAGYLHRALMAHPVAF